MTEAGADTRGAIAPLPQTAPLEQMKADLFKAMGNPMRIRVLELLSERERAVGEMILELGVGASALSQQLGVLRGSGLVRARREASTVYYSITTPRVADLLAVGRQLRADLLSLQVEMLTDLRAEDDADAADPVPAAPTRPDTPGEQRNG
jgi:ArsR family transcriptional regulator